MTTAPRSRWWVGPAISSLLTLPPAVLALLVTLEAGLVYSTCDTACPPSHGHVAVGLACLLTSVPLLIGAWVLAHAGRFWHTVLCVAAPALALASVVSYFTMPHGR
ncbi:hypothetical protein ACFYNO_33445 [Kitasatospora sp. NPDC006697]|uniref:hypothetical protein n=1 Tax=Kitasatospora sp. NPDC006697 TaxID=3364020 RepID=UPI003690EBC2